MTRGLVRWVAGGLLVTAALAVPAPAWAAPKPHPHASPKPRHVPPKKAAQPAPQPTPQPTPTAVVTRATPPAVRTVVGPRPTPQQVTVRHSRPVREHAPAVEPVRKPAPPAPRAVPRPRSLAHALSAPQVLVPALRRNASVPIGMIVALVLFLFVQGRIDRRDPKLLLQARSDEELVFGLPRGFPESTHSRPTAPRSATLSPTSIVLTRS